MIMDSKGPSALVIIVVVGILGGLNYMWYQKNRRTPVYEMERPPIKTLGFIRAISTDAVPVAAFDDAVWLTGREAEDAAIKLGVCTEATRTECAPNGYLITNNNQQTVAVPFAPEARIEMATYRTGEPDDGPESITLQEFTSLINDPQLSWKNLPYHVTLQDNRIIKIEEQYIP